LLAAAFAAAIGGCSVGVATPNGASSAHLGPDLAGGGAAETAPAATPPMALPFKGRLIDGDPADLPPAVAGALSNSGPIGFNYREELTHDEYHIPMILSAWDPLTYAGAPLGDYGVTAFATLTISEGSRVVADYTAKAHVSKSYNLYFEPKHSELDRAARDAVRDRIDKKLFADADRVAHAGATE